MCTSMYALPDPPSPSRYVPPFPPPRSQQQGLRAKQAQLEIESDMQGRDKVLGEENIGHNLLKKMGELLNIVADFLLHLAGFVWYSRNFSQWFVVPGPRFLN